MKANSIIKVRLIEPDEKYPFSIIFKEGADAETADPEAICGVFVDFGEKQFVACIANDGTDDLIVFDVAYEAPDCEKDRRGMKAGLTMTNAQGFVDETYNRAWAVSANENPDPEDFEALRKALDTMM